MVGSSGIDKAARIRWSLWFRESKNLEKTAKGMETQLCWLVGHTRGFHPKAKAWVLLSGTLGSGVEDLGCNQLSVNWFLVRKWKT